MARTITQEDVLNGLHNLIGHRVTPGGTDEDLLRYIQDGFDYCWRYWKWTFSLKSGTIDEADGLLPTDYDHEGYRSFDGVTEVNIEDTLVTGNTGSAIIWDTDENRYRLEPIAGGSMVYQYVPPTLSETAVPFPSAMVVAEAAVIFAKLGENPTRADVQQEWDMLHSHLDRLVGRADANRVRVIRNRHDVAGTYTGDVGA